MASPAKKEKLQRTLETLSNALEVEIDGEQLSFDEHDDGDDYLSSSNVTQSHADSEYNG